MDVNIIRKLNKNAGCSMFLSKPHGLELLFILSMFDQQNADNGIDDTFDAIQYHRPRRAAFSSFIGQLHAYHHITKSVSPLKGSKQILRLSEDTLNGLAKALAR